MRLEELYLFISEHAHVVLLCDGKTVAEYDGKNSIPVEFNQYVVEPCGINAHGNIIYINVEKEDE